jgi:hypothetical protein
MIDVQRCVDDYFVAHMSGKPIEPEGGIRG